MSKQTIHRCDFCGKTENEVEIMIAGDNADICSECVMKAVEIIAARVAKDLFAAPPAPADAVTENDSRPITTHCNSRSITI
jgi:ATP-dependent protease Clp ATPase subunit